MGCTRCIDTLVTGPGQSLVTMAGIASGGVLAPLSSVTFLAPDSGVCPANQNCSAGCKLVEHVCVPQNTATSDNISDPTGSSSSDSSAGAPLLVAGGVVAALAVVLIVVIAVLIRRRRARDISSIAQKDTESMSTFTNPNAWSGTYPLPGIDTDSGYLGDEQDYMKTKDLPLPPPEAIYEAIDERPEDLPEYEMASSDNGPNQYELPVTPANGRPLTNGAYAVAVHGSRSSPGSIPPIHDDNYLSVEGDLSNGIEGDTQALYDQASSNQDMVYHVAASAPEGEPLYDPRTMLSESDD